MKDIRVFESGNGSDPQEWIEDFGLYAKINNWQSKDWVELLKLYLGKKERWWYKKNKDSFTTWEVLTTKFVEKFGSTDSKFRVWDKLKSIKQEDYESIEELELELNSLLTQANITDDEVKVNWLISSLKSSYKKRVEEKGFTKWDEVTSYIACTDKEDEAPPKPAEDKTSSSKPKEYVSNAATKSGKPVKELNTGPLQYGTFLKRFEELSVNLLSKVDEVVEKRFKEEENKRFKRRTDAAWECYYCQEVGHRKFECPKRTQFRGKESIRENSAKPVNFIEVEEMSIKDEDENEQDIFAVEKRKYQTMQGGEVDRRVTRARGNKGTPEPVRDNESTTVIEAEDPSIMEARGNIRANRSP
ncbi:hypothetical protein AX774_g4183 [Zancudomyces culisetae]|uniref:CCHC-type domain-containing protein n=1 Tax=Zancudomyces culisetae TaxID=1213189 RepID=A0A1R1PMY7_ZANCU|nr:hypothetical protein AX774_g4183 [Zancudomyces culisetae]|eukprot:OMH82336.1 hypothetical protein AX774_g4183 [Zancudomyces culisetae]